VRIKTVQIRHFRSIENATLASCGGMNVLIGKNNAGKSNLLTAIAFFLRHLRRGLVSVILSPRRSTDEFTDRIISEPYRIAVEFELPESVNLQLRERLSKEAPHLDKSIEQIKTNTSIVFVLAGVANGDESWQFLEQVVVGSTGGNEQELKIEGIRLLSVPASVGRELAFMQLQIGSYSADMKRLQDLSSERRWIEYVADRKERFSYPGTEYSNLGAEFKAAFETAARSLTSADGVIALLNQLSGDAKAKIEALRKRETEGSMSAFAGPAKLTPAYALWLMEQYGSMSVLQLEETKQQIGREEAETLLDMKLQRGGMDRLQTLQQTIRALLGVAVDAFQAGGRGGERRAEMDVDNFLVEANGAGIRESLRLILDLELKEPNLLLVEEPEIHLHPGLARVMAGYLRDKSKEVQMFVTTHSTEFVDSVAFQNAYLISRDEKYKTTCQAINAEEGPLLLPSELGLRLSTVFMFDRLLFVEGPSDEGVLRMLAKNREIDFTKSNIGFVHMRGVRNFAHFAAEGTLDLLSKRQIHLWFLSDRDERDDQDVANMLTKLGGRATLKVLKRRELENYLLDGRAVRAFINDKRNAVGLAALTDDTQAVAKAIEEEACKLKDEVIRLKIAHRMLAPVFLNVRTSEGSVEERIRAGIAALNLRLSHLADQAKAVEAEITSSWNSYATALAPGTLILENVARRYGVAFSKEKGDSERLAQYVQKEAVPHELLELLEAVTNDKMETAALGAAS
jgi:putative ATP-dependent endonuclease of OLD family